MEYENFEELDYLETSEAYGTGEEGEVSDAANGSGKKGDSVEATAGKGEEDSVNDYLYTFTGIFFQRYYRTQLRPKEWTRKLVYGDTVTEIIDCLWNIAMDKIERQVLFDDDIPRWSENDIPSVNDANEFVTIQDTNKKKFYAIDSLTARNVRGWKGKTVRVYVPSNTKNISLVCYLGYMYGRRVSKQVINTKLYCESCFFPKILTEREHIRFETTKLWHRHIHLEGHYSSWLLWANLIHSAPVYTQDAMNQASTPPIQLSKYFRWVATSEPSRLEALHKGMIVAQHNNSGWLRDIGNLKKALEDCKKILDGACAKVAELEQRGNLGADLFRSMEMAVHPEEMELSQCLADDVADCDDVDHQ